jgi:hypothetical protein
LRFITPRKVTTTTVPMMIHGLNIIAALKKASATASAMKVALQVGITTPPARAAST